MVTQGRELWLELSCSGQGGLGKTAFQHPPGTGSSGEQHRLAGRQARRDKGERQVGAGLWKSWMLD